MPSATDSPARASVAKPRFQARLEVEEEVYRYEPANNGASPMWCRGSTCIVRHGTEVIASGIETLPGVKPLHNVRWLLFQRGAKGWALQQKDEHGRTREPCPLGIFPDGRLLLSVNPTLTPPDTYSGPAQPQVLEISAKNPAQSGRVILPQWDSAPSFTEHSYRSFAVDGPRGEWILFQNIGYTHAHYTLCDAAGQWPARGRLDWPWGADYEKPQAIRICYPNVALRNRAVYFCGVSDIDEPNRAWRDFKFKQTGNKWDYDFRRLFFAWSPDIRTGKFEPWLEIASREKTGGWIMPDDLHVATDGAVHLLWSERALDGRLRAAFFPDEKQKFLLMHGIVRDGKVVHRRELAAGGEGPADERPGHGRFHVAADGRLFVFYHTTLKNADGAERRENRILELCEDGSASPSLTLAVEKPLANFFTATPRAGAEPSDILDVLGDDKGVMRYLRIRIGRR